MLSNFLFKPIKKFVFRLRGAYTVESLISLGLQVGKNFNPQHGFDLDPSHCWLISIGDDVTLAPNVQLIAHDASTCNALGYAKIGRITIGSRVFIGAGSIILPNVSIGDNVIIGAGSVVTHSIPPNTVCAGNPAKVICSTEDYISRHRKAMETSPIYSSEYTLREHITIEKKIEQRDALINKIGYVE